MSKNLFIAALFIIHSFISSFGQSLQTKEDSIFNASKSLPDITIVGKNSKTDIQQLPEIVGTSIYAGKKSALIVMNNVQGNVANNTMRQVLSKVAGIHIWESDPSGIQIGIAARGLSPNRSWEFNIRQNGYDIAADPFGYPEAYYNPQLQSVQRIEREKPEHEKRGLRFARQWWWFIE
jgi:Fe(3+) dicitrate transport protein